MRTRKPAASPFFSLCEAHVQSIDAIDYLVDDEESSDDENSEDERDMDLADSFLDAGEVTEISQLNREPACLHPLGFVPCNTLPGMFVLW